MIYRSTTKLVTLGPTTLATASIAKKLFKFKPSFFASTLGNIFSQFLQYDIDA
jgi:hypothetical protein